jgi:hypothetical protein
VQRPIPSPGSMTFRRAVVLAALSVAAALQAMPAVCAPVDTSGAAVHASASAWQPVPRAQRTMSPRPTTSTNEPAPRYAQSAILDTLRHRMLMFGGSTANGVSDELWALPLEGTMAWQALPSGATAAPLRTGHEAVLDPVGDRMVVFGGSDGTGPMNGVWVYPLSGNGTWSSLSVVGTPPAARQRFSAIQDPVRNRLIVFGGLDGSAHNDVWTLSLVGTSTWTQLQPLGPAPAPRFGASVVYDPRRDQMVVFGGVNGTGGALEDLWTLSLGGSPAWTPLQPAMAGPSPRTESSVAYDPSRDLIWFFSGGTAAALPNDLWTLSLSGAPTWQQVLPADGDRPVGRAFHTAILDPATDRMVVSMGYDHDGQALSDSWILQLGATPGWSLLENPLTPPVPVFVASPSGIPAAVAVGQSFTIACSVRNSGGTSDDGRIAVSFPGLTDAADGQWVTSASTGDTPGYTEHPAGSALVDVACQPMTSGHLVVEYGDNNWQGYGNETNDLSLTVQPRTPGTFYVDVRATMHERWAPPCPAVTTVPAGGVTTVDQQGFPVTRFAIQVTPAPPPSPTISLGSIPATFSIGQSLTLNISVRNDGGPSDDGHIVVSFPTLTDPADGQWVTSTTTGDTPGYVEHVAGSMLVGSGCQPVLGAYLVADYGDNSWYGYGQETNDLRLTVLPQATGTFYLDVRASFHEPGTPACSTLNATPNGGTAVIDPQGFPATRYAVQILPPPPPVPNFYTQVLGIPSTLVIGQSFTMSIRVRNDGGLSDDGRVVVGFPGFADPADGQWVSSTTSGDAPGYSEHPAGSTLLSAACQPVVVGCLVAEYGDDSWGGYGQESNDLQVSVQPQALGTFYVDIRATMHNPGDPQCPVSSAIPGGGNGLVVDAQGFTVARFAIQVTPSPPPRFTAPVTGIPTAVPVGQSFTLTLSVSNDGGPSDDGRIVVSFPTLTDPADGQWVDSPGGSDAPGYVERPAGSALTDATCQPMTAGYLVAEYDDNNWQGGGSETNTLILNIRSPAAGAFYVDIRATMHLAGCIFTSQVPAGGGATVTDQEGFLVRRFEIPVVAGVPATSWAQLLPPGGGPSPRLSSTMIYHPVRDALVLYGGQDAANRYRTDDWVLPLSGGAAWTQLTPGGPLPGWRINQGAIFNPREDHIVIFGGFYEIPRNDLTDLALSPLVWWFPATQSGPRPSPRFGHSAVYDAKRHRMLVIGGFGDGFYNDVWEYLLPGNGTWTQLQPTGTPMPPRTQQAAVYDPLRDRVLFFGGDGGYGMNDVWELRLDPGPEWREIHPAGVLPAGRRDHSMIYDPVRDRLVVFGGFDLGRHMNDVWTLSLGETPAWSPLLSTNAAPGPRSAHAAVYDPIRDRMIIFGGEIATNQFSGELWALTLETVTPTQASFAGADVSSDHVTLTWLVSDPGPGADVLRSSGGAGWTTLGGATLAGDHLTFEDRDVVPGTRCGYRLVARDQGTVLDEQWITVPPRAVLALEGASPNPAPDELWVAFSLPAEGHATLELFDLGGRMITRQEVGALGPGEHRVALSDSRRLAAGLYWVRLTRGDRVLTAKACVVR